MISTITETTCCTSADAFYSTKFGVFLAECYFSFLRCLVECRPDCAERSVRVPGVMCGSLCLDLLRLYMIARLVSTAAMVDRQTVDYVPNCSDSKTQPVKTSGNSHPTGGIEWGPTHVVDELYRWRSHLRSRRIFCERCLDPHLDALRRRKQSSTVMTGTLSSRGESPDGLMHFPDGTAS